MTSLTIPNPILRLSLRGTIEDISGRGIIPVATDVTMIPDPVFGTCASFNGTTSKISIESMVCPKAFTLTAWVKRHPDLIDGATIAEFGDNRPWLGLRNAQPCFKAPLPGSMYSAVLAGTEVAAGWSFVAVTVDASRVLLYVHDSMPCYRSGAVDGSGVGLGIGRHLGDKFFRGELAEVHVFDQALSAAAVRQLKWQTNPALAAAKVAADQAARDRATAAAAKIVADAAAAKGTVLHNLVLPGFTPNALSPAARAFYQTYGDDYDFLVFVSPPTPQSPFYSPVRREVCAGLGHVYPIAPVREGDTFGSPARLKGVVWLPLDMREEYSPPTINHELLHYWGTHLSSTWPAFITGQKGHWGYASTNGSHGGFDLKTLRNAANQPIGDPLSVQPDSEVRVAQFGAGASSIAKPYSPIELYLMGLVDSVEIPQDIFIMKNPVYLRTENAVRTGVDPETYVPQTDVYRVGGFTKLSLADLLALNAGGPPRATQTSFRVAFVLVSEAPATDAMVAKAASYAKLAGRLVEDRPPLLAERLKAHEDKQRIADTWEEETTLDPQAFPPRQKYLSFEEAAGGRANLDVSLTPRTP